MTPCPPRPAMASSATARGPDVVAGQLQSSNEANVRAAGGREGQEEGAGGFHGLSDGVDDLLLTTEAGDDDGDDVDQSATEAEPDDDDVDQSATATKPGYEEALQPPKTKDPSVMRLSRRIARSGIASRREAERMVEAGVVMVNGATVQTPALNVGPRDIVKVNVGLVLQPWNRTDHGFFVPVDFDALPLCLSYLSDTALARASSRRRSAVAACTSFRRPIVVCHVGLALCTGGNSLLYSSCFCCSSRERAPPSQRVLFSRSDIVVSSPCLAACLATTWLFGRSSAVYNIECLVRRHSLSCC